MEPAVHDGDRLLADTGRKPPGTGEMAVPRDGGGLVIKRASHPAPDRSGSGRAGLSANPACEPCTRLADEARIAGTVIRALGRM